MKIIYLTFVPMSWCSAPKSLGISWMIGWRLVARGTNHMIRGLELSAQSPASGEGSGTGDWVHSPVASDWMDHVCAVKLGFRVGEHVDVLGGWCIWRGQESPALLSTPIPALRISSLWLFLSCILYNKAVSVSKSLSWVLWVVLANYWTWGEVMGTPKFTAGCLNVRVVPGTCQQHLNWGQFCGTEPLQLQVVSVRIELNCGIQLVLECCRYLICLTCELVTIISSSIWPSRWSFCGRWMNSTQRFMSN